MNNIMQLIGMIRGAGNPMQFLQSQAQSNPMIARVLQMTQGKNDQEIMQIANNMAREQGVDLNQMRSMLGI